MTTDTAQKIINYVNQYHHVTAKELVDYLGLSRQAVHRQLGKLVNSHTLAKIGKPPKVFYTPALDRVSEVKSVELPQAVMQCVNENYVHVSPVGDITTGLTGFIEWCSTTGQPIEKTAKEYARTIQKYHALRTNGVIDGTKKLQDSFDEVHITKMMYVDFYSIERFGKTKLGKLLLYAKQSQSKELITQVVHTIQSQVEELLQKHRIDAVGFIPPTVKRQVQLMEQLEKGLGLDLPTISIIKVVGDVAVPQKSLVKLNDRIENARRSLVVREPKRYQRVLLIDDAVGSGATLNETAKKLREQKVVTDKVFGLALTGSYKGFDVISEL